MKEKLIVILGPTAVGKTRLAAMLAAGIGGEIISADSRQVYKGMDIGTGKDLSEYIVDGYTVPYHMIDILSPGEEFDLFRFQKEFYRIYVEILGRGKIPVLAGGTGLYISSVVQRYELTEVNFKKRAEELMSINHDVLRKMLSDLRPEMHNTTDLNDKSRTARAVAIAENEDSQGKIEKPETDPLIIGVKTDMVIIRKRISERLKKRLAEGMTGEVEKLLGQGISFEKLDFFGLEYRYIGKYLQGELNYNDMYQKLNSAICQFAKRQMTWFRKMEREGVVINWIEPGDLDAARALTGKYLNCI